MDTFIKLNEALLYAKDAYETRLLIKIGADVNSKNVEKTTVLMFAKTAEQTKLLIDAGADVNAKDVSGRTALMFAKTAKQTKHLIDAGANVNAKNVSGQTALMFATEGQKKILEDAIAKADAKDYKEKDKSSVKYTIYVPRGREVDIVFIDI